MRMGRKHEDGKWSEFQSTYVAGEVECAKDSSLILLKTFMPYLDGEFTKI